MASEPTQRAEFVWPKPGPIDAVAYDEDGGVLNFWQPLLDAAGNEVGRINTETEKGREHRRFKAWKQIHNDGADNGD